MITGAFVIKFLQQSRTLFHFLVELGAFLEKEHFHLKVVTLFLLIFQGRHDAESIHGPSLAAGVNIAPVGAD